VEKLIYPLWEPAAADGNDFCDHLLEDLAPRLLEEGVRGLRLAVVDDAVSPAQSLRQQKLCEAPAAMISLWLDSAWRREPVEALIAGHSRRFCGYVVAESAPLVAAEAPGERVVGMNQVVFLERPPRLSREQWLHIWLNQHTGIAIETQSTFAYRQNIVVRQVCGDDLRVDAIVEEAFPAAAMTSPHAFYDVQTDAELQSRLTAMIESCARFIDFDRISVTPMSDYLIRQL
jgi:hypothetical protein